jgi:hypothetical protein
MFPSELIISKSLTLEKQKSWEKTEFSLKINLEKNDDVENAKVFAEMLIDSWLKMEK